MLYLLKVLFTVYALMLVGLFVFRWALATPYRHVVSARVVGLALLTPIAALFSGNVYVFFGYLVVAVAFNARSRAELAANYAFLLPLSPILAVETGVGSVYIFAISAVFAMNAGALIGFVVSRGGKTLVQPRFDICVLLLIGIFVFAYNRDSNVTSILRGLTVNILTFGAPYLLISRGLSTQQDVDRLLLRLTLGGFITAVTACFQAVKHWVVFEAYHQALHVPAPITSWTLALRAGLLRTGGSMLDYSAAGLFLATVLTLVMTLRSRFRSAGYWIVIAVLVAGLVATQSRGAWIAAFVGMLFVFAYHAKWGRVALASAAVVVAYEAVLLFARSGVLATAAGITGDADVTVSYRQQLFWRGLEQVRMHPLFGQSPDMLIANLPDLVQGEHIVDFVNAHLYVAMIAGVPLFIVWCYIWLLPVTESWKRRRAIDADLVAAPAAIIVPAMVAMVATAVTDRNALWPTMALGIAGPCFTLMRRRSRPAITSGEGLQHSPLRPQYGAALPSGA